MGISSELKRLYLLVAEIACVQGLIKEKDKQVASLKEKCGVLECDCRKLHANLQAAEAAAEDGKIAQKRAAKAANEIAALRSKHDAEGRRRRQAELELEQTKLITTRDHKTHCIPLIQSK